MQFRSPGGPVAGVALALAESRHRPLRVLCVEDYRFLRESMALALREQGCLVETAEDGVEGLNRFRRGSFDVVITDNQMPRMGGVEFLSEIQELGPLPKIIVYAGSLSPDLVAVYRALGAEEVLLKGPGLMRVMDLIRTWQRRSRDAQGA